MEPLNQLTNQSTQPVAPSVQNVELPKVGQQLTYPLDYVTQRILEQFTSSTWPVGSVYHNVTDSRNPREILGIGTWVAIERYVIAGYKSGDADFGTAGATIGSTTHTLTESEIPPHAHDTKIVNRGGSSFSAPAGGPWEINSSFAGYNSGSTGGGDAHNNIQPTLVAYSWYRTA